MKLRDMPAVAFVQYDDESITGFLCKNCLTDNDKSDVPIKESGAVVCSKCGEVCE